MPAIAPLLSQEVAPNTHFPPPRLCSAHRGFCFRVQDPNVRGDGHTQGALNGGLIALFGFLRNHAASPNDIRCSCSSWPRKRALSPSSCTFNSSSAFRSLLFLGVTGAGGLRFETSSRCQDMSGPKDRKNHGITQKGGGQEMRNTWSTGRLKGQSQAFCWTHRRLPLIPLENGLELS